MTEPAPAKKASRRIWLIIAAVLGLAGVYLFTPVSDFLGWLTLDVASFNREVDGHMRRIHREADYACLYTVTCDGAEARIELRTELTPAQLKHIRSEIWRRRFETYCTGHAPNFALEHGPWTPSGDPDRSPPADIYVFPGGFGGADGPLAMPNALGPPGSHPPCTRETAYWTREHGVIAAR